MVLTGRDLLVPKSWASNRKRKQAGCVVVDAQKQVVLDLRFAQELEEPNLPVKKLATPADHEALVHVDNDLEHKLNYKLSWVWQLLD